jgi:hypothetical protein
MRAVTEGRKPEGFFKYYIVKACQEAEVNVPKRFLQIEYLSKMLAGFIEPHKYFNDSGDLVRIIDVLKEEVERVEIDIDAYRKAADKILFYQSFFPEAFKRRLLDIKFYSRAAKAFYRIVGNYKIPVCGMISMEYSLWSFILRTTKQRYLF